MKSLRKVPGGVYAMTAILLYIAVIRPAQLSAQAGHVWYTDTDVILSAAVGACVFLIVLVLRRAFRQTAPRR